MRHYLLLLLFVAFQFTPFLSHSFQYSCINSYTGEQGKFGPRIFFDSPISNAHIPLPSRLKIFIQNFENLGRFTEVTKKSIIGPDGQPKTVKKEETHEKSENQKIRLALRIKKQDPDIIMGVEVKDIETAQAYVREYLNDEYYPILIEGNDFRGIDVCFFVRKTLNLDLEVQSHKKYPGSDGKPIFSRDFPALLLRTAGAPKRSPPLLALFATHLKSRMGADDANDKTAPKRGAQVLASLQIMNDVAAQFPNSAIRLPSLMGGDLNNRVHHGAEFKPIFEAGFLDTLDIAQDSPPADQRQTHYFFTATSTLVQSQLDAAFANKTLAPFIISSTIQRDILPDGSETPIPKRAKQVNSRGSDHDGISAVIDLDGLLNAHRGR